MFEIGSSLEDARRRQHLELADAATATKIRVRYLAALEHERFELLPPGAYRQSFLREYAEFLGLDGDLYVVEYESRFVAPEFELPMPPPRHAQELAGLLARLRLERPAIVAGVALLIAVTAWRLAGSGTTPSNTNAPPQATRRQVRHSPADVRPAAAAPGVLVLSAARGDCWLSVRIGGSTGRVIYEATLLHGGVVRFGLRRPLWIRLGAPWNLEATIAGRSATSRLPQRTGDVLVRSAAVRPTSH